MVAPTVAAADTEIGVVICGSNAPGASVKITEPNDDSVVDQSTIVLRGTVGNTSQIEITIDGNYSNTIAIGSNQTRFSSDVHLTDGTHTVQAHANDVCGNQDADDEVVITYQPKTTPSNGGITPTDVNTSGDGNGVVIGGEPSSTQPGASTDPFGNITQLPVIGPLATALGSVGSAAGIPQTLQQGGAVGIARIVLTIAAITVAVYGGMAASALSGVSSVTAKLYSANNRRFMLYGGWTLRLASVAMIALAYSL